MPQSVRSQTIGGTTVHGALCISIQKRRGTNKFQSKSQIAWRYKQILIIDKISMTSVEFLDKVNEACKQLKTSDQDFVGIMVMILAGDILGACGQRSINC